MKRQFKRSFQRNLKVDYLKNAMSALFFQIQSYDDLKREDCFLFGFDSPL